MGVTKVKNMAKNISAASLLCATPERLSWEMVLLLEAVTVGITSSFQGGNR